jgi:hypothetical protein
MDDEVMSPFQLGKRSWYRFLPTSLCLQDELNYFARGASPRKPASGEVADGGQLWCSIGYTHCQSSSPCERNIWEIVAHVDDLFLGYTRPLRALLESFGLPYLPQIHKGDLRLFGTLRNGRRMPTGDETRLNPHSMP